MNINEILKGIDKNRLQQLVSQLSPADKAELLKKIDKLSEADVQKILGGR